ncbi:Bcr/CflA family multidrug efflux MFS transporter [uncultured Endozoicomonas sp.]|uniref:Bcr/CflA family multidrug efflux MFS transporter n=1 Tax=uncultured Endozoicomonas sp. TaxID=432652 RepID=UPI00262B1D38|nr:Bcr/CflA family multidrug efflux MFS transporter [uncultured Endozoicomonas sp.]
MTMISGKTTGNGMTKKEYLSLILTLGTLTALGPLAIDLYLPAMPAIASSMGEPLSRIQYTLSAYTIGFALSQLIYGPLSDRIGRRKVMYPGIVFFALTSFLAAYSTSAIELIIVRILQAFSAAAIMVTIPAMIRDLMPREQVAKTLSSILMVMTVAPLAAPLLGGQILKYFGWEMLFVFLAIAAVLALVLAVFRIKETLKEEDRLVVPPVQLALNYANILRNREAMGCILCHSLFFGGMFAFIAGSPFIYIELYGVQPDQYGLLFAINILAMSVTNMVNIRLVEKYKLYAILRNGSLLASVAALVLLFNAATGFGGIAGLMIPIAIYISCIGFTGPNSNALALSHFPKSAGSANALAGALRFIVAGIASALVGVLHNGTAIPMAAVMAGCGLLSVAALALTRHEGATKEDKEAVIVNG